MYKILYITIGLILIILRGINSPYFIVDATVILLYFLLSIPLLSDYIKKAKIGGAELKFKDNIQLLKKAINIALEEAQKNKQNNGPHNTKKNYARFFNISLANRLINEEPKMALASLRVEIESKFKQCAIDLDLIEDKVVPIKQIIYILMNNGNITEIQYRVLLITIEICNMGIEKVDISKEETNEIIDSFNSFNKSFSIKYTQ